MTDQFASIHGRFQPFHNGHLNYARAALQKCGFLYVGITQVERNKMKYHEAAPHRSVVESNPLSFFERKLLIEETLRSEGIHNFSVIPFPIEREDSLTEYYPEGGVCYTTLHSEWNSVKIEILRKLGYDVRVLDNPDQSAAVRAAATEIRKLIRAGDDSWKTLVPPATAAIIEDRLIHRFR